MSAELKKKKKIVSVDAWRQKWSLVQFTSSMVTWFSGSFLAKQLVFVFLSFFNCVIL
jgi:hypothetical protein